MQPPIQAPDESATALGAFFCLLWLVILIGWLVGKSHAIAETVAWFRRKAVPAKIFIVCAFCAVLTYGSIKGGGNAPQGLPRPPLLLQVVEPPPIPAIAPVSVWTNGVALRAESTNAVEITAFRTVGGSELGDWIETAAPFFAIGTNPVNRCFVSASGSVSFDSMRRPPVGSALPDGTGLPVLCPLRAHLGMVPEANWGGASRPGEPLRSRFWHDALPGGGRVLTWENALVDRLPGRRVSLQVEMRPTGDSVFRYAFHDELDPPPTNFVMGAQMGTNGVNALSILGTNTLAATVWNVDGAPVTNGVSIADLLCTNGVLRTPSAFEIRWKNTTGLDPEADTDNDGLTDWAETFLWGTEAGFADTDGDGIADNAELMMDMNPRNPDTDGDGMADGWDADPTTAAASPAFGQSAVWLVAAGVDGTTNALEWAQGVVATNEEAHVLGISVAGATPAFPASVSLSGFPTVILDDDTTLWFPVAVADAYAFDFICDAELEIGIVEPPPHLLLRSGNDDVHTVEGSDGWNLVSTARGKCVWYMRKPWQQLRNCTGDINSTWMSFEVETRPRKGGTYTWSSMPEEFLQRVDGNRALCLWPDDSQVGTAEIRVVWEKDTFAVTNFLVIGRPPEQEGETPLLSLDIDGGTEGIVFVQTNGLGLVVLQGQEPAYLTCRVASTSAVASVTLDCPQSGKVRVRTMVNGHETEISLPYNWNPQTTGTETAFKVLGAETSDAVRDIRFTAMIPVTPVSAFADMTVARVEHVTWANYPVGRQHRCSLGVGEEVYLTVFPRGTYDGAEWTEENGSIMESPDGDRCIFEAPETAGNSVLSFDYCHKTWTETFAIYAPEAVRHVGMSCTVLGNLPSGRAGNLGLYLDNMHLYPTNVSFYRLKCYEGECSVQNCTGYFAQIENLLPSHGVVEGAYRIETVDVTNFIGTDAFMISSECPPLYDQNTHEYIGWTPGRAEWHIPNFYYVPKDNFRTIKSSDSEEQVIPFASSKMVLRSHGTGGSMSLSKFGWTVFCTTNRDVQVYCGTNLVNLTTGDP